MSQFPVFGKGIRRIRRHGRVCRACRAAYHREWASTRREKLKDYLREYAKLPKNKAKQAEWRKKNSDYVRNYNRNYALQKKYGLTSLDYARMVAEQGGHCASCGGDPTDRGLVVDHCHATGKVRALLCEPCNLGLGNFKDSPELLRLGAIYIEKHSQRNQTP